VPVENSIILASFDGEDEDENECRARNNSSARQVFEKLGSCFPKRC